MGSGGRVGDGDEDCVGVAGKAGGEGSAGLIGEGDGAGWVGIRGAGEGWGQDDDGGWELSGGDVLAGCLVGR